MGVDGVGLGMGGDFRKGTQHKQTCRGGTWVYSAGAYCVLGAEHFLELILCQGNAELKEVRGRARYKRGSPRIYHEVLGVLEITSNKRFSNCGIS